MTTTNREQALAGLRERVEAATGPDREIDKAFVDAFGSYPNGIPVCANVIGIAAFTGSTDSALALVDQVLGVGSETLCYSYDLNYHCYAHAHMSFVATLHLAVGDPAVMQTVNAQGPTLPLAICRALLAALRTGKQP